MSKYETAVYAREFREIRNRFQVLADMTEEDTPVSVKWDVIKKTYVDAATKTLGYKKKNSKK